MILYLSYWLVAHIPCSPVFWYLKDTFWIICNISKMVNCIPNISKAYYRCICCYEIKFFLCDGRFTILFDMQIHFVCLVHFLNLERVYACWVILFRISSFQCALCQQVPPLIDWFTLWNQKKLKNIYFLVLLISDILSSVPSLNVCDKYI